MSSGEVPDNPSIGVSVGTSRRGLVLPWSWPEGSRVLLAVVSILMAIGLMVGSRRHRGSPATPHEVAATMLKLDPNMATPEALAALPHIGPTLARRIADARAEGPFRSAADLRARVRGIGPATLAKIEPYLRIDAPPPGAPRPDTTETMIADARASAGDPPPSSRRTPRSRKRKGSSVQLVAKGVTSETP